MSGAADANTDVFHSVFLILTHSFSIWCMYYWSCVDVLSLLTSLFRRLRRIVVEYVSGVSSSKSSEPVVQFRSCIGSVHNSYYRWFINIITTSWLSALSLACIILSEAELFCSAAVATVAELSLTASVACHRPTSWRRQLLLRWLLYHQSW